MRAPSFAGLKPASQAASLAKRMNRNADTIHEKLLRSVLWRRGFRFRKNLKDLPGKPDIVFTGARVVVFCDGDFWHGRNWRRLSSQLKKRENADYWRQKIRSNMIRDERTTGLLSELGWYVIRLWEGDIRANPENAALVVEEAVTARRMKFLGQQCAS
jgi:DNA mismatch endonuclease (patch repair protein)